MHPWQRAVKKVVWVGTANGKGHSSVCNGSVCLAVMLSAAATCCLHINLTVPESDLGTLTPDSSLSAFICPLPLPSALFLSGTLPQAPPACIWILCAEVDAALCCVALPCTAVRLGWHRLDWDCGLLLPSPGSVTVTVIDWLSADLPYWEHCIQWKEHTDRQIKHLFYFFTKTGKYKTTSLALFYQGLRSRHKRPDDQIFCWHKAGQDS